MDSLKPGSELFRQLTELLRLRIGLNPESVGKQMLEHAVAHRLKALKLDASTYVRRLAHDTAEWNEFLEEIIVPESWFFREVTPFTCVREFVRVTMQQANRPKLLRFLSVPCSRGEEPYSLSMTLLDAGLLPSQYEIVACDLSERSLEFARRGRYRAIAFRETDAVSQRLTRQHFQTQGDESHLQAGIRASVKFRQGNLAVPDSLSGLGQFDFIFCRNVLIYLTEEVRQRAMVGFERMLKPGGLLYLGHSECRLGLQAGAVVWNANFPAAFTWSSVKPQRSGIPSAKNIDAPAKVHESKRPATPSASNLATRRDSASATPSLHMHRKAEPTIGSNDLSKAKELADSGKLDEAETLCRAMLQSQPPSADVYCLLGVIVQARGELTQAEVHYHKSLFLEPDHVESLTHVLLLARLRGDTKLIENYQRRLERLRSPGT